MSSHSEAVEALFRKYLKDGLACKLVELSEREGLVITQENKKQLYLNACGNDDFKEIVASIRIMNDIGKVERQCLLDLCDDFIYYVLKAWDLVEEIFTEDDFHRIVSKSIDLDNYISCNIDSIIELVEKSGYSLTPRETKRFIDLLDKKESIIPEMERFEAVLNFLPDRIDGKNALRIFNIAKRNYSHSFKILRKTLKVVGKEIDKEKVLNFILEITTEFNLKELERILKTENEISISKRDYKKLIQHARKNYSGIIDYLVAITYPELIEEKFFNRLLDTYIKSPADKTLKIMLDTSYIEGSTDKTLNIMKAALSVDKIKERTLREFYNKIQNRLSIKEELSFYETLIRKDFDVSKF